MTGTLHLLERKLLEHQLSIENWFEKKWTQTPAPVYGSVDLRNAGFKLAPIDMNLFPAGFNNLNPEHFFLSVEAAKVAIQRVAPSAKRILLIPESHTRNLFYWENVSTLNKILTAANFDVRIGSLEKIDEVGMLVELVVRHDDYLGVNNFIADVILLNNDLSDGIPDILKNLQQPLLPPAELGWSQRLKSKHFEHYETVVEEFSKLIQIDSWAISSLFRHCGEINFMQHEGETCLITHAEELFAEIQRKYDEYDINCKPFLIVKAESGTYGMAVMTVRSVDELRNLNRKQRTKMSKTKGGRLVQSVILQEGVYTFETIGPDNVVAEPVVYMWGQRVVGGFYRMHKERGIDENLNSPGMQFIPLAFQKPCHEPLRSDSPDECQNRFYAYGVIARLSMLAAAREISEQKNEIN
jgi:glutamate--cysteine ligase